MTCKRCGDFAWEGRGGDARGKLKHLYESAKKGCSMCVIIRETIDSLLPTETEPEMGYILYTVDTKDRTDMLHPQNSKEWTLNLRIEKEPFLPEHDMVIYAAPGESSTCFTKFGDE